MITDDKIITTAEYWDKVYSGNNNDAKVDASNTVRTSTFDRFEIVVKHVEGPVVLGIGSGHAHIEKRVKALHPEWYVIATDQSAEAKKVANYNWYYIVNAYNLPEIYYDKDEDHFLKGFDTIICTQALEYMEFPDKFLTESKRVAKKMVATVPLGEMKAWSQLRIYTEENTKEFFEKYGTIEVFEVYEHLILIKVAFND